MFLFFPVRMYYNENADLSDDEDDKLLPLDIEVRNDDDEENQAVDDEENQAVDDEGNQAVNDQGNQAGDDQQNQAVGDHENQADAATTTAARIEEDRPEFGPHRKLSRGEDLFEFRKEVEMVKEKKIVCSLELFLNLFVECCRTPGCDQVPKVKHHFVGTTVVVTAKCQAGHIFKFASSREVNGLYVNNLQSAAATLLSGNNFGKSTGLLTF